MDGSGRLAVDDPTALIEGSWLIPTGERVRIIYPLLWSSPGRQACREQTVNTVAALARRGHDITVLMPQGEHDAPITADELRDYFQVKSDFRLIQRPSRWAGESVARSLLWLRQVFDDREVRNADLLLSRIPVMLGIGQLAPIPFAIDHYRRWPDELPFIRWSFRATARHRRCAGLIMHSAYAADAYLRAGIPASRILIAHNGVPVGFEPLDKAAARQRLQLPGARPIVVYAGRMNEEKGLDQLLAVARLRPHVLFVLVGSEGTGPVERAAAALDNVQIAAWAEPDRLPEWLQAADVLVLPPSRAPLERFRNCVLPMKLFAYLGAGRPILAPRSPDTAELLEHEVNALLVEPNDPKAAAAALDRLLADRTLSARLGIAARKLSTALSWDRRAEILSTFLEARLAEIAQLDTRAQRSVYSSTVTPPSATMTGAVHAPTAAGK